MESFDNVPELSADTAVVGVAVESTDLVFSVVVVAEVLIVEDALVVSDSVVVLVRAENVPIVVVESPPSLFWYGGRRDSKRANEGSLALI